MVCKNCKTRMRCFESANSPTLTQTARIYRCDKCQKLLYTVEVEVEPESARMIISAKHRRYRYERIQT